jgi:hypothetical protein
MQNSIRLFQQQIQCFLRYIYFVVFGLSILSNEIVAQNKPCASEIILREFERIGVIYEQGDNSHPVIRSINAYTKSAKKAAYCGSTIGWICANAGIEVQGMPTSLMSVAKNWERQGEVVWHNNKGWTTITHVPQCDEIFVMFFTWGSNHVEIATQFHGGLNFIDGAGNTSNSKVRKPAFGKLNAVRLSRKERIKAGIYVPMPKREGIFAHKERYQEIGLVKILKFKVRIL